MQNYNSHSAKGGMAKLKFKSNLQERCFNFSLLIIALADVPSNKGSMRVINNQVLRSATSIGANLIEARASSSRREFKKFYEIALKSANETKYWLGLLRDATTADKTKIANLLSEVGELSNMLGSSLLTLKHKRQL